MTDTELSREIAKKVMGWEPRISHVFPHFPTDQKEEWWYRVDEPNPDKAMTSYTVDSSMDWHPLADLDQAFQVVERMRDKGYYFRLTHFYSGDGSWKWRATFTSVNSEPYFLAEADTPARAICEAALKAVEAQEPI